MQFINQGWWGAFCRDPLEARITIFLVQRKEHLKNIFLINFELFLRNVREKVGGNFKYQIKSSRIFISSSKFHEWTFVH
jgi:hypothetical protein